MSTYYKSQEYPEQPSGDFNCAFYWRSPNKKLHNIFVSDAENLQAAQKLVMQHLHETMEVFVKPVLALIKGGKA